VRPNTVFHLAGYVRGARDLEHVLPAFSGNLVTTVNLLTVATDMGARRIVLAGSMEEPAEEGDHPSSPYAAAKWAAGGYARMFFALYQTPVVVARLFMTYGPGQEDRRKLIPYVTTSLLDGEAPRLSSGRREVDWIYVSDVVEGLLAVAAVPHLEGAAVDLGSGALVPIRTVVRKLVALVGAPVEPLFGALPERPLERVRAAERAATEARLGWRPVVDLDEGLRRTVEWYRSRRPAQAFGVANFSEGRREP
jgi:nucleoside-diphosphate-sugar epimerase